MIWSHLIQKESKVLSSHVLLKVSLCQLFSAYSEKGDVPECMSTIFPGKKNISKMLSKIFNLQLVVSSFYCRLLLDRQQSTDHILNKAEVNSYYKNLKPRKTKEIKWFHTYLVTEPIL